MRSENAGFFSAGFRIYKITVINIISLGLRMKVKLRGQIGEFQ